MGYDALAGAPRCALVRDTATVDRCGQAQRHACRAARRWPTTAWSSRRASISSGTSCPACGRAGAREQVLHAWKAGPQTTALRAQLEAMPDGGTFVMTIPAAPYRCPPGPYERACQVAHYFSLPSRASKVLLLDANADVVSKGALFKQVWAERYAGHDRVPAQDSRPSTSMPRARRSSPNSVTRSRPTCSTSFRRNAPARSRVQAGLARPTSAGARSTSSTFESKRAANVHVLGDALQTAPFMPKSAHMANQHAKVCAAAIVDAFDGRPPNPAPMLTNTCYSYRLRPRRDPRRLGPRLGRERDARWWPVRGSGGVSARAERARRRPTRGTGRSTSGPIRSAERAAIRAARCAPPAPP